MGRSADPVIEAFEKTTLPELERLWSPSVIVIFGSRARGDAIKESDIDVLIVSDRFNSIPFLDRGVAVLEKVEFPVSVDLLCYTPREFATKRDEIGTVQAAVEEGIVVLGRI